VRDAYQVAKVRAAEAALLAIVPDGALMQRAAAGLASVCASLLRSGSEGSGSEGSGSDRRGSAALGGTSGVYGARVVVLAGTGDNGGDALYAGSLLAARGAAVTAIQAGQKIHPGGSAALTSRGGRVIAVTQPRGPDDTRPDIAARYDAGYDVRQAIGRADLIIDGMLGIGGSGGLREPYATLAQIAATASATTVAVDLPSGIDADTGAVDGPAVRADVTVTFGALKPGLLVDPGASHAGVVELVDIGLRPYLEGTPDVSAPQRDDIAALLPRPGIESDKYRRGVLGLLAGSDRFTGAALLSTGGAVRGGAGMVRLVTAPTAAAAVRGLWPEVVITELERDGRVRSEENTEFPQGVGRVQAWVAGPGMGTTDAAAARLAAVLATSLPVLVDADGLSLLARRRDLLPRPAPTLLTPHAGELGRLLGKDPADITARRLEHARLAATQFGACVLLKGSTTVIAPPDGLDPVFVNTTGTSWLATAGTGDVLSGLAGSLLAQGLLPPQAAIAAAYLHGLAARLAASDPLAPGQGGYGGAGGYGGGGPHAGRTSSPVRGGRGGYGGAGSLPVRESEAPIGAHDVITGLPMAFRVVWALYIDRHGQSCAGQRRPRRDRGQRRGAARARGAHRRHGGGEGRRLRARGGRLGPRGAARRRAMARRGARGGGAPAARRRHRQPAAVPDGDRL